MRKIPMLDLVGEYEHMKADIDAAIRGCLEHQKWILGPEVKKLEQEMQSYLGVKHCIGASSGTEALVLALRALAIKRTGNEYFERKDEIITTPFTFTATGDAILRSGATPVFVDIDPRTHNIDLEQVKACLAENGSHVVGLLPVHLYGQACDMTSIRSLAEERGLFVVEDVAQAFGATWQGRKLGTFGDAGGFSFFPSKNLGGFGDGGLVSTNDDQIHDLVRMLLKHGGKDKYNVDHIGYNARLDTIQAAVLLAKLRHIDDFNERRMGIASAYSTAMREVPGIALPLPAYPGEPTAHVFHQYTIRIEGENRDGLQKRLAENGVDNMIYYPVPLHRMKVFEGRSRVFGALIQSETASREVLSLPIEPLMGKADVQFISGCVAGHFQ